jgi:nitric oxide reductase subunit C
VTSTPTTTATATPTTLPSSTATLAPTKPPEDAGDLVAYGLEVYRKQYCGACHELSAVGSRGTFGPVHDSVGAAAAARIQDPGYSGRATTAAGYLRESIIDPKAFVIPGYEMASQPMPVYDYLSDQEIMALVQMLLAQQ